MIAEALKLSVYFGESVAAGRQLASDALMERLAAHDLACVALLRGIEGYGINRRIHAQRFPDVSTDLPLLAMAVGERERIRGALRDVDDAVPRGLVTLEAARLATGTDASRAQFPDGPGSAVKLTIYCRAGERVRGRPAYREAVELLRRTGATGAIVLRGVDGTLNGRRGRARLFAPNGDAPMVIISVGPANLLRRSLPRLGDVLREPVVTLEGIAQVKHDGHLLEPPPMLSAARTGRDVWQTIRVYTRRVAEVGGHPLYSELTRRLRAAGAAGATTILGEWGFSSDEVPHGDKLGRVVSHQPTYTVYIDRPEKVAEVWPLIDEVTAEHGIVTSLLVPGYRERAGETVHGSLDAAERVAVSWRASNDQDAAAPATRAPDAGISPWLAAMLERARAFADARGVRDPVVRVTLADGESFYLMGIEDGPGEGFVTLHPHPERADEMLGIGHGTPLPPRAVIVPHQAIAKVELLAAAPRGSRSLVTLRLPR
jgi:PII-like signaling protein